jgi:Ni/Fe-hydrogenase subunit HybB-like protein
MSVQWRRYVRLDEPLYTKPFFVFASLAGIAFLLGFYREFTGLGYVTGLNDGYSWGLFKNWNVTALTALGSGGYAVAILTWLFGERKFHPIMRTALLTSFLGYGTGMLSLGFDVGRPWNFLHFNNPRNWNSHSVLAEVAICMTAYVIFALDVENMPPFLERMYQSPDPAKRQLAMRIFYAIRATYPFFVALAFLLPTMHQASLGELMFLAGPRVHPLWQTARLPLLYLMMAYILGLACVLMVLLVSSMVWKFGWDFDILNQLTKLMGRLTAAWLVIQYADLAYRHVLGLVFKFDFYGLWFLAQTLLLLIPALLLWFRPLRNRPGMLFALTFLLAIGGIIYRFTPTTIAFLPLGDYRYFPSVTEILMSIGFTSFAVTLFLIAVKKFAILPAEAGKPVAGAAVQPFDTL